MNKIRHREPRPNEEHPSLSLNTTANCILLCHQIFRLRNQSFSSCIQYGGAISAGIPCYAGKCRACNVGGCAHILMEVN